MTTKQNNKSNVKNDVRSSSLPPPPSLYNIQYPNSRRGMFSLRTPFTNFNTDQSQQQEQEQIYTRNSTPNVVHPKYLHIDQNQQEQPYLTQSSQRDAQVQCSIIDLDSRDGVAIRRHETIKTNSYDYGYLSPRYRVQLNLQPTQPNIYEVWDVQTPPRSIPINEPIKHREKSIRVRSPRVVNIQSLSDDDESDDDDYLVYAHYPPRVYYPPIEYYPPRASYPPNVRMVSVRQDANTICF